MFLKQHSYSYIMKLLIFFIVINVLLVGCGVEFGQNYAHLQNQDPTKFHEVDVAGDLNRNVDGTSDNDSFGSFDNLNNNLCNLEPLCCGIYSDEEKNFRDLEKRAIFEEKKELCYQLPEEPLVFDCGNDYQGETILYSRERCFLSFGE